MRIRTRVIESFMVRERVRVMFREKNSVNGNCIFRERVSVRDRAWDFVRVMCLISVRINVKTYRLLRLFGGQCCHFQGTNILKVFS